MEELTPTYRLVLLSSPDIVGRTAASPDLAKLVPGDLGTMQYRGERLGIERTDWVDHFGKPKVQRSVLIEAEDRPGQWTLGV